MTNKHGIGFLLACSRDEWDMLRKPVSMIIRIPGRLVKQYVRHVRF